MKYFYGFFLFSNFNCLPLTYQLNKTTMEKQDTGYERIVELYELNSKIPVRVILKESKVIQPFCAKVKLNKEFDINGRLNSYRLSRKPKKIYDLYLYKSTTGEICFSNRATRVRSVYSYHRLFNDSEVESINFIDTSGKKEKDWNLINKTYLLNNIHENLWGYIKDDLKKDAWKEESLIKESSGKKLPVVYIHKKFPKWVCDRIKEAIENKTDYSYRTSGIKRDLSVEIKLGEDGNLRAWYSSEYAGCGNGAYYILINPKVAAFCEYD